MADLPSILGGMAQGFIDFGKGAVDLFGTGGAAIGDLVDTVRTGKVSTKNQDDFRKWLYNTNDVQDAAAKGLGTALNGVQTVTDYIPGIGAVTKNPLFNAGQGALGGLADEFKTYGKDYDLGRAGERAAVSAGAALASGSLGDALKKSANPLLSSGTVQGLARGATGGAITGGGYAAIDGGDVMQGALQGAGTGALIGGATGAIQDFMPRKATYDMALTDEEKAARIANAQNMLANEQNPERIAELNDQIKKYGGGTAQPDYLGDENSNHRTFYHGTPKNPTESGDTLGSGLYITSNKDRATGYANGGEVTSYDTSGLNIANLDDTIPENVAKVLRDNPELSDKLKTLTPTTETYDLAQRDAAYNRFKALKGEYPRDLIEVKKTDSGFDISYPGDVDYTKITGKDIFRKLNTPEAQDVFMRAGYDGVSKTALGGDTEMAIYRNAPQPLESILSDADMAVNSPRYITDENGNPMTLYHGSPNKNITEFDINQAGKNTSSGEHALYFTDSPEVADDFSYERLPSDSMFVDNRGAKGRVYPVNLEMNNPLDLDNLTDAQIRELWQYASPLGQLDGQEKFIKNLTEFRDAAHNGQLTKTLLDLDKLANSQYDGFTARMYPNQDNQAREYAVFDNSKVKMLEDALANGDRAINDVPEIMESRIAPGQLGLFDDMPTQAPKTGTRQTSLFDQPQEASAESVNPYAPVDGKLTQAMKDRYWDVMKNADGFGGAVDNELYNKIDRSTLPKGYDKLQQLLDSQMGEDNKVSAELRKGIGTDMPLEADLDRLVEYVYGDEINGKQTFYKDLDESVRLNKKNAPLIGIDAEQAEVDAKNSARTKLISRAIEKAERKVIDDVVGSGDSDDIMYALQDYRRRGVRTGSPGALDTVLSERLGIAPGNTVKVTDVTKNDHLSSGALGRYARSERNIALSDINSPEGKVSTMAHERLHSFQNESRPESAGRYSPEVAEAYKQLQKDLGHYYKSNSEIKKRYGRNVDYWASSGEQESRMFQQYLENKGYTDDSAWRKMSGKADEWGNEINPAFDKFIDKLRDLSKRGVALPAITALLGGGAYMASQNNDKEKEVK